MTTATLRHDRASLEAALRQAGAVIKGTSVRCPFHDDANASGSLYERDEHWRFRCHACGFCGDLYDVLARATGTTLGSVLADERQGTRTDLGKNLPPNLAEGEARDQAGGNSRTWPTAEALRDHLAGRLGTVTGAWPYNADFSVVRFDKEGRKTFRPLSRTPAGWVPADPPGVLPLYGLEQLDGHPRVYVAEDEKCVEVLRSLRLTATTSAHGSKAVDKTDWRPLAGRDVVLLPDHDSNGRDYADMVAMKLSELDPPATVRIVELPDLPEHGDIADWVGLEGPMECKTADEIRDAIEALAATAPTYATRPAGAVAVLRRASEIKCRPVEWLWPGRFPSGKLSLLIGHPGASKSLLTVHMASYLSTGRAWPDGHPCPTGPSILLSGEDDPEDTTVARLKAAGADLSRVVIMDGIEYRDPETHELRFGLVELDKHLGALRDAIRQTGARMLVLDPISSFVGDTDDHKNAELRGLLAGLSRLASDTACGIVAVSHLRKAGGLAVHQAVGSLAYVPAARAVWALLVDAMTEDRRMLLPVKCNLARGGTGLAYSVVSISPGDGTPTLRWEPEPISMAADDVLNPDRRPGPPPVALEDAREWLADALADGPRPAKELLADAEKDGHTTGTLRRAKTDLGVRAVKGGFDTGWQWVLPGHPNAPAEGAHEGAQPSPDTDNLRTFVET